MADLPFGFSPGDDPDPDKRKKDPDSGSGPDPLGFGGGDFDMADLGQIFAKLGEMFSGAGNVMGGDQQSGPVNYDLARQLAGSSIGFVTPVSEQTSNEAGVIIAKCEYRRISNVVEHVESAAEIRLSRIRPGGKNHRSHIADPRCVGACQMASSGRKLSLLDVANCDCETGQVVVGVAREEPFAQRTRAHLIPI